MKREIEKMEFLSLFCLFGRAFISGFAFYAGAAFIFYQSSRIGEITPLELQSYEELRITLLAVLELSITSLGESLPVGRTWEELAQEIHRGTTNPKLLILIINELSTSRLENPVIRYALLIIRRWGRPFWSEPPSTPWDWSDFPEV